VLVNGVKFSWTTPEIVNKIYDQLTLAGFLTIATNVEGTGRALAEVVELLEGVAGNAHRLRTAVRTNVFEAINEARYALFTDPSLGDFIEAIEYSAILDSRTTEICRHLDGRIYPATSDQWNSIRPPNHFNCRSLLVPVTVIDTEVVGKDAIPGTRNSRPPTIEPQSGFGGETG
jgi:SPP1 gp7 family putative phage head morphogenesis protein